MELRKCECGGAPEIDYMPGTEVAGTFWSHAYVECKDCGLSGESFEFKEFDNVKKYDAMAIKAWNEGRVE